MKKFCISIFIVVISFFSFVSLLGADEAVLNISKAQTALEKFSSNGVISADEVENLLLCLYSKDDLIQHRAAEALVVAVSQPDIPETLKGRIYGLRGITPVLDEKFLVKDKIKARYYVFSQILSGKADKNYFKNITQVDFLSLSEKIGTEPVENIPFNRLTIKQVEYLFSGLENPITEISDKCSLYLVILYVDSNTSVETITKIKELYKKNKTLFNHLNQIHLILNGNREAITKLSYNSLNYLINILNISYKNNNKNILFLFMTLNAFKDEIDKAFYSSSRITLYALRNKLESKLISGGIKPAEFKTISKEEFFVLTKEINGESKDQVPITKIKDIKYDYYLSGLENNDAFIRKTSLEELAEIYPVASLDIKAKIDEVRKTNEVLDKTIQDKLSSIALSATLKQSTVADTTQTEDELEIVKTPVSIDLLKAPKPEPTSSIIKDVTPTTSNTDISDETKDGEDVENPESVEAKDNEDVKKPESDESKEPVEASSGDESSGNNDNSTSETEKTNENKDEENSEEAKDSSSEKSTDENATPSDEEKKTVEESGDKEVSSKDSDKIDW